MNCNKCGKIFKDNRGVAVHIANCKGTGAETSPPSAPQEEGISESPLPITPEEAKEAKFVTFRSPRIKSLRIVVVPSMNRVIETPTGNYVTRVDGKTAEFVDGIYRTNDPEIIECLTKYSANKKNARYPVISDIDIERMRKTLN
jgi:hypothetical protein